MVASTGWLRKRIFGLSPREATFARRGFHAGDHRARLRLERIGHTFLKGYHAALECEEPQALTSRLNGVESDFRGFAFEGASMALALLDTLTPWNRDRWRRFVAGPASGHVYMSHVGLGWALARLKRRVERPLSRLDPLLGWLAIDGYGFHEGYFYPRRYVEDQEVPTQLSGYARRVFDQGLGRSLWFVEGADVARVSLAISDFHPSRQADLWSGVGLACSYAGGSDAASIEALREMAGPYKIHMAQGAAFAAKARRRAGNLTTHTEMACGVLCGMSADIAARITDDALVGLSYGEKVPAYEVWRQRIRAGIEAQQREAGSRVSLRNEEVVTVWQGL